jgi:hypothetical protein
MPGSIGVMDGSRHVLVTWNGGYHAAEIDGALVVLSPAGAVVARSGDRVEISGGEVRPGEWFACGGPMVRVLAPS